jgi:hypothetical protein
MKTKFSFTLLAFSGLALTGAIATVPTNSSHLSQTIAKSLGLDPSAHNLITAAIDRAVLAKKVNPSEQKKINSTGAETRYYGRDYPTKTNSTTHAIAK